MPGLSGHSKAEERKDRASGFTLAMMEDKEMNAMFKNLIGCTVLGLSLTLAGCGNDNGRVDTPGEKAGAAAANAGAAAADATRDAAHATGNAAKAVANDVTGNKPMDGTKSEAREIADDVADEAKDIKNEVRDFFVAGQGSDEERLHEYIEQVDEQLEEYADRIEDEQDNTKRTTYQGTYTSLQNQRNSLNSEWERLKGATAETWADAKAGLNNAMNKLDREMREFGNNFRTNNNVNNGAARTTGTTNPATGS